LAFGITIPKVFYSVFIVYLIEFEIQGGSFQLAFG
jgi:hypothetical protein